MDSEAELNTLIAFEISQHRAFCCVIHGCYFINPSTCPVEFGKIQPSSKCAQCENDNAWEENYAGETAELISSFEDYLRETN